MRNLIFEKISRCEICAKIKPDNKPAGPSIKTDAASWYLKKVQVDLTGPYSISNSHDRMEILPDNDELLTWKGELNNSKHWYFLALVDTFVDTSKCQKAKQNYFTELQN